MKNQNPYTKAELETLLSKLTAQERIIIGEVIMRSNEYKADVTEMYDVVCRFMDTLGLMAPGGKNIIPEIASGEQAPIPIIMKAAMDIISMMGQAQVPIMGASAKKRLGEKFNFIPRIVPMVKKYAQDYGG